MSPREGYCGIPRYIWYVPYNPPSDRPDQIYGYGIFDVTLVGCLLLHPTLVALLCIVLSVQVEGLGVFVCLWPACLCVCVRVCVCVCDWAYILIPARVPFLTWVGSCGEFGPQLIYLCVYVQ